MNNHRLKFKKTHSIPKFGMTEYHNALLFYKNCQKKHGDG